MKTHKLSELEFVQTHRREKDFEILTIQNVISKSEFQILTIQGVN